MAKLTKYGYLQQLTQTKSDLEDYIHLINQGKQSHLKGVATKLRLLYFDEGKSIINKICDLFDLEISVYVLPSHQEQMESGIVTDCLELSSNFVNWFNPMGRLINIFEVFERQDVFYKG